MTNKTEQITNRVKENKIRKLFKNLFFSDSKATPKYKGNKKLTYLGIPSIEFVDKYKNNKTEGKTT